MRRTILSIISLSLSVICLSQNAQKREGKTAPAKVVSFPNGIVEFDPSVQLIQKIHAPVGDYAHNKRLVDSIRKTNRKPTVPVLHKSEAPAPQSPFNFDGNVSSGTPNDNDMCIGNDGTILSVVNSSMFIYDSTGFRKGSGTLAYFGIQLGSLDRSFDPRVLYDPNNDRYILVFLNGTSSTTNTPVLGFTKTNDPNGEWHFYQIPGNPFNDTSWSDYPIISINEHDIFLTLNLLQDDKGWKDGFRQSVIWQIDLNSAYAGDSLAHILWSDIKFNNQPVWSICPSQSGLKPEGAHSHFLSVRPGDIENDTLFVHTINNSVASGKAELNTRMVKCNQKYGLPPSALQPNNQYLETNDARVLTAMHQNGLIHFAGNTRDFQNNAAGIYYGVVDAISGDAQLKVLSYDTLDLGYPDIAYAGTGSQDDHTVILTFSHVSQTTMPGTSVITMNYSGQFSGLTRVKEGRNGINVLLDTFERWGDYNGIQRKYNEDRAFWLSGNYGDNINRTVIAKVVNNDPALAVSSVNPTDVRIFPNPSADYIHFEFDNPMPRTLYFRLYDLSGKEVMLLHSQRVGTGKNRFRFATTPLTPGTYILVVEDGVSSVLREKISVVR